MARTLAEVDADLAAAEARITTLTNAGQNLRNRVDALEAQLAHSEERATAAIKKLKSEIRSIVSMPSPVDGEPKRRIKMVRVGGRLVARAVRPR